MIFSETHNPLFSYRWFRFFFLFSFDPISRKSLHILYLSPSRDQCNIFMSPLCYLQCTSNVQKKKTFVIHDNNKTNMRVLQCRYIIYLNIYHSTNTLSWYHVFNAHVFQIFLLRVSTIVYCTVNTLLYVNTCMTSDGYRFPTGIKRCAKT